MTIGSRRLATQASFVSAAPIAIRLASRRGKMRLPSSQRIPLDYSACSASTISSVVRISCYGFFARPSRRGASAYLCKEHCGLYRCQKRQRHNEKFILGTIAKLLTKLMTLPPIGTSRSVAKLLTHDESEVFSFGGQE